MGSSKIKIELNIFILQKVCHNQIKSKLHSKCILNTQCSVICDSFPIFWATLNDLGHFSSTALCSTQRLSSRFSTGPLHTCCLGGHSWYWHLHNDGVFCSKWAALSSIISPHVDKSHLLCMTPSILGLSLLL